jgi:dCTP deaminase
MCIVGKSELLRLISRYKCIHPFNELLMDGDGYVLSVKEDVLLNYLEHKNIISHEIVFTPPNLVAHLTAKSRYGRLGLSFLNAAKVHSGFVGRLALELVNLNNTREPIMIRRGDPFMHIEFITRQGNPSPYLGPYMFQYMDDDEVEMYISILVENFPECFNKEKLRELAKNRVLRDF